VRASGRTIFLDEVGSFRSTFSALAARPEHGGKTIGAAQHVPVDVRIIAATNRDLRRGINRGAFAKTSTYVWRWPACFAPLRERPGDIPLLCAISWRAFASRMAWTRLEDVLARSCLERGPAMSGTPKRLEQIVALERSRFP